MMRRFNAPALVVTAMAMMWLVGCGRNDLIDQGGIAPGAVVSEDVTPIEEPVSAPPAADPAAPSAPIAQGEAADAPAAPAAEAPAPAPAAPAPPPAAASAPKPAAAAPAPASSAEPAADEGTVVIGRITVVSKVPRPSEVPYTECLTMIKYAVEKCESGSYTDDELLAAFWGMRGAELQPAASFEVGQRHRLVIEPLANHPELLRAMQADDTNEFTLPPQWVLKHSAL